MQSYVQVSVILQYIYTVQALVMRYKTKTQQCVSLLTHCCFADQSWQSAACLDLQQALRMMLTGGHKVSICTCKIIPLLG